MSHNYFLWWGWWKTAEKHLRTYIISRIDTQCLLGSPTIPDWTLLLNIEFEMSGSEELMTDDSQSPVPSVGNTLNTLDRENV